MSIYLGTYPYMYIYQQNSKALTSNLLLKVMAKRQNIIINIHIDNTQDKNISMVFV